MSGLRMIKGPQTLKAIRKAQEKTDDARKTILAARCRFLDDPVEIDLGHAYRRVLNDHLGTPKARRAKACRIPA